MQTKRNDAERRRHRFSCPIRTGERVTVYRDGTIWDGHKTAHKTSRAGACETMPRVTRAFAWQGVRITPGAHTLYQPAGPLGGLILRTRFWAQFPTQNLGPRALYLTVGCEAHGPRFVAAFWARNPGLRIEGPKGGCGSVSRAP